MGCCGRDVEDLPKGMVREGRGCTDVLCMLLFGAFWAGMAFVGYTALQQGDPGRILYGIDSYGNYCGSINTVNGVTLDLREATKLYYTNPLELLDANGYQLAHSVCVAECPKGPRVCAAADLPCTSNDNFVCPYYAYSPFGTNGSDALLLTGAKGPTAIDWWEDLPGYAGTTCADAAFLATVPADIAAAVNGTGSCGRYYQLASMYPGQGPCAAVYFETAEFMHRCYPVIPEEAYRSIAQVNAGGLASGLSNVSSEQLAAVLDRIATLAGGDINTYVTDAQRGFAIVLAAGLASALALCLLYMLLLRFFAGIMAALSVICLLLTLLMVRRIKVAVAVLKVAASAVGATPSLLLFPLITFTSFAVLFVYWIIVLAYQWSAGATTETHLDTSASPTSSFTFSSLHSAAAANVTLLGALLPAELVSQAPADSPLPCYQDPECYYSVTFSREQQYLFAYHLFGLLWTNQFIVGFGYVVVAHVIGQYYWTRGIRKDMTALPVATGIYVAARYHLGSIAFGAFVVAVIQFVRLLLEYVDRKTKRIQRSNPASKWVLCCLRYCLWFLEKLMKFINRNAYIIVAIKGYTFCGAAMRAVKLIVANVARLAAVNVIGDGLIFLGKLTVVLAAGCVAFLMTNLDVFSDITSNRYISSPLIPVLLSCLSAYVVASIFFAVYEMAVDTILLSFCEDCAAHNETPQYAPKLLMSALGKAKKFREQQEAAAQAKVADTERIDAPTKA